VITALSPVFQLVLVPKILSALNVDIQLFGVPELMLHCLVIVFSVGFVGVVDCGLVIVEMLLWLKSENSGNFLLEKGRHLKV
jgi:hypothetical protein